MPSLVLIVRLQGKTVPSKVCIVLCGKDALQHTQVDVQSAQHALHDSLTSGAASAGKTTQAFA